MRWLVKTLKSVISKLLLVAMILASVVIFLITTTPGLSLALKLTGYLLPGTLTVEQIQGRLLSHCSFGFLSYQDETINITLKNIDFKWALTELFHHKLNITTLMLKQGQISLTPNNKTNSSNAAENKTTTFTFPTLPFDISFDNVFILEAQLIRDKTIHKLQNIKLQGQLTNKQWQIKHLNFDFDSIHFNANFASQTRTPYALSAELKLKNNSKKNPPLEGIFKVGGDFSLFHWEGELKNPTSLHSISKLVSPSLTVFTDSSPLTPTLRPQNFDQKSMMMNVHGTLKNGHELHTQAQWQDFIWPLNGTPTLRSTAGQIKVQGHIPDVTLELNSTIISPAQAEIIVKAHSLAQGITAEGAVKLAEGTFNFNLNYNEATTPKIQGSLLAKSIDSKEETLAVKDLAFNSKFSGDSLATLVLNAHLTANYFNNPLLGNINYQQQHLRGKITIGPNRLEIKGTYPYQWQVNTTLPKPQMLYPSLAGLDTTIVANASLSNFMTGKMNLTIRPGYYQFEEGAMSRLPFLGGQLQASLTPENLNLNGLLTIDKDKSLKLAFKLPQLNNGLMANQAIQGNLRLDVNSLSFLQGLSSEIDKPEGQLSAVLKAKGTLVKPIVDGKITLKKGQVSLPNFGLDFHAIQLEIQSQNRHWKTQGSLTSNDQTLTLAGKGAFAPQVKGLIHLNGDNFTLINTPEYLINISPKLVIEFTPATIGVKGTVVVPKAQIKPQSFTNSASLSEDVVFEGTERPANPFHINTDVRLEMGDDVSLSVKGLKGLLTGAIHLHQLPQEPLNATGELSIKEGKYQAYGQDLAIDQGQLLFTGGSVLNPGIRVRAIRQFNNTTNTFAGSDQLLDFNNANLQTLDFGNKTTVGIEVTGRLTSPKVELFSIPSTLSQADILSMLLLGRPARQANKAGGQILLAAISSMNLGSGTNGTQLVEQLKQTLGVDINLASNSKFDAKSNQMTEKTSVVVGKSLSKRLYVSYNYGLAKTDSNVVTLTYLLNKFFSLQVDSSLTGSGIDLLYTHRKE